MPAPRKYPDELRERAMRLVAEASARTRAVVERGGEADRAEGRGRSRTRCGAGASRPRSTPGAARGTTSGRGAIKELEREVRELKRANEILLAASSFFARELDPRLPWWCAFIDEHRAGSGSSRSAACCVEHGVQDRPEHLLRRQDRARRPARSRLSDAGPEIRRVHGARTSAAGSTGRARSGTSCAGAADGAGPRWPAARSNG